MKNLNQLSWKNAIARSAAPKAIALAVMATLATGAIARSAALEAIAKLPSTAQPSTQPNPTQQHQPLTPKKTLSKSTI
ncbi:MULTISPECIES: hypothetical protein [Cyanophyceae]|uniref:hypothetical protein n=1 Tax=Cyanophyceae TaxID=3028117 RepID=UPI001684BF76|nr:hypothetical protein [Trichocoleus sp. FACHB-40]MBD2001855.1 hypothetical protein [Trichocoleus sp. FACHB-40]